MHNDPTEIIVEGLAFPEGPRWHAGRFWFTDQHAGAVCQLSDQDRLELFAATEDRPGGLGWLPDGSLLVVYMTQRRLMRRGDKGWALYADLSELASYHCNDLVVDRHGVVFAGNFGEPIKADEPMGTAQLIRVDPTGRAEVVDSELIFPNGSAITEDGRLLLVAETFAHRITCFDLDEASQIANRRLWANLGEATPDGICLDAEGALWVASPATGETLRVARSGAILDRCRTRGTPYACMLGGSDRKRLYICTSETDDPAEAARIRSGRIEAVRVEVPGAGLP
jgi:sugar lactone lactonase YvrE